MQEQILLQLVQQGREYSYGIVVNMQDCNIIVIKFKLQLCY